MKTICITGHSGSGKSTITKLLKENLPNLTIITKDDSTTRISMCTNFKEIDNVPIKTDDIMDYCRRVAMARTGVSYDASFTDIPTTKIFLDLVSKFFEDRFAEKLDKVQKEGKSDFVVLDWIYTPKFKIWDEADSRIIVKPSNWKLLEKNITKRSQNNNHFVTPEVAQTRYLSAEDVVSNAPNIINEFINSYDARYENEIDQYCKKILSTGDMKYEK